MQYIPKGPDIPEEVELALGNDDLVLFCGAGISAQNNLPLFEELVEQVCKNLHIDINKQPLLKEAWDKKNYDSILDLVEGGQSFSVSRETVRKEVIKIFKQYDGTPDIHKSLLELSALKNGDKKGYRLVTTNFDELFSKAKLDSKLLDFAPKLAPPRKESWSNLTFLHGVINEESDPEGNNLILTRRDFGLAYLYDNWASRFVIQLFQDFTILFIGYSLNDPVMNYLVSAISYENQRRRENKRNGKNSYSVKPSIYAFVRYKEGQEEIEKNRWRAIGIEPIPYKVKVIEDKEGIKKKEDHSLLYNTIKEWADWKRRGFIGRKNRLKEKVKIPYKESDKETAESVISYLKIDERLAQYFPQINLSSDPHKTIPVDISWLKPLDKSGLLNKLRNKKVVYVQSGAWISGSVPLWECLSTTEYNIAKWLCLHLDQKELIYWAIEKKCDLHPDFKEMIQFKIKNIENNKDNKTTLEERKLLFWKIITNGDYCLQKTYLRPYRYMTLIKQLKEHYCEVKAQELLKWLEPYVEFKKYSYYKEFSEFNKIYEPQLTISIDQKFTLDEKTLRLHSEDFSNLLKKAMALAKMTGIVTDGQDPFHVIRPFITPDGRNRDSYSCSWTYLIDLVIDSFDCAMKKDEKLAQLLFKKWQCYPYSIFERLILYAVTKYSHLNENIILDMFKNKNILWSFSYQNEVLKYLKNRAHSKEAVREILSLIMQGPSKSLFRESIDNDTFNELKERGIYERLNCLKESGVSFPKKIDSEYNRIQVKYSIVDNNQEKSLLSSKGAHWVGSEKRYHHWTDEQIFEEIKYTKPYTYPDITCKKENFRSFIIDFPERAFKILSMFQSNDINSVPYWSAILNEISSIKNTQQSNEYFLKSLQKMEGFGDKFIKKYLWSLIDAWDDKAGAIYYKNKNYFKKWWDKLWRLSIESEDPLEKDLSDFSFEALNSELGKLSHSIFRTLWSKFPKTIPKGGKIPEDIKNYFQVILQEGVSINPSVLFHFGSDLYALWHLDRKWTIENIKSLMDWKHSPDACKALWSGYSYHMRLNSDFLIDFRAELLHLFLNGKQFYTQESNNKIEYCEAIAELFFITTGGKWITNIFTKKEMSGLIHNLDTDILESISRKIWVLLKDSKNKSATLWSEKIGPWWKKYWPPQTNLRTQEIAQNLSLAILHCGEKLPKSFELLGNKIKGIIQQNNNYIIHHIEDNKKELNYIFDYPEQLLSLLNWNFPENKIYDEYDNKPIRKILDTLKGKYPDIEKNGEYNKLIEKVS